MGRYNEIKKVGDLTNKEIVAYLDKNKEILHPIIEELYANGFLAYRFAHTFADYEVMHTVFDVCENLIKDINHNMIACFIYGHMVASGHIPTTPTIDSLVKSSKGGIVVVKGN